MRFGSIVTSCLKPPHDPRRRNRDFKLRSEHDPRNKITMARDRKLRHPPSSRSGLVNKARGLQVTGGRVNASENVV